MSTESLAMIVKAAQRTNRAFDRRKAMPPKEPWWCSVSCLCERCLDFDAFLIEFRADPASRPFFPVRTT